MKGGRPPYSGQMIGGTYELERPIGGGGMGVVWIARHTRLKIPVAVKFLLAQHTGDGDLESRFEREAMTCAQIDHPNVIRVLDFGAEGVLLFIVMELLTGEDLAARLRRVGSLPPPEVSRIISEAAKGLEQAHAHGLIHRDLKPNNLFLAQTPAGEVVKLIDFGIVKDLDGSLPGRTVTGQLVGSPHYMSPEQLADARSVDTRSDLWSLGVVAFKALTGALPFPGLDLGDVVARLIAGPPATVTSIIDGMSPAYDAFFARALAREPGDRFPSATALADALESVVARTQKRSLGLTAGRATCSGDDDDGDYDTTLVRRPPREVAEIEDEVTRIEGRRALTPDEARTTAHAGWTGPPPTGGSAVLGPPSFRPFDTLPTQPARPLNQGAARRTAAFASSDDSARPSQPPSPRPFATTRSPERRPSPPPPTEASAQIRRSRQGAEGAHLKGTIRHADLISDGDRLSPVPDSAGSGAISQGRSSRFPAAQVGVKK